MSAGAGIATPDAAPSWIEEALQLCMVPPMVSRTGTVRLWEGRFEVGHA